MPAPVRPKGSGSGSRSAAVTPMSERQQMALLMQMTSSSGINEAGSRSPSSSTSRSRERNERGETPLHLAAIKGDVEQVCKLLAHRADPNAADFAGWTPLHEACNHGWYEVALRLVQSGANVNARGLDNDSPLHDAVINGHFRLVKLLVERGADIHAKNSKGKTPLDVAPPVIKPYLLNTNLPLPENTPINRPQARASRDDKKISIGDCPTPPSSSGSKQQKDSAMDAKSSSSLTATDDVYEFKSVKDAGDSSSDDHKGGAGIQTDASASDLDVSDPLSLSASASQPSNDDVAVPTTAVKRGYSEATDPLEETGAAPGSAAGADDETRRKKRKEDNTKEGKSAVLRNAGQNKGQNSKQSASGQNKSGLLSSVKGIGDKKSPCSSPKPAISDAEVEDGKTDLKVPPLKIVIPQTTSSEQDTGAGRNGKSNSQRAHPALPYVVTTSNSSDSNNDKDCSQAASTSAEQTTSTTKGEEKKDAGTGGAPEEAKVQTSNETEASTSSTASTTTAAAPAPVELHPRKRKMKQNKDQAVPPVETQETPAEAQVHPHEQPITNCYQLYLNIRKQIAKRRRGLFPVQPKPPQGFKDYLMNRCTYVLAGTAPTTPNVTHPQSLPTQLKDLFTEQEKERYRLRTQHVIEKEKLVLSVEQEILRVHGRAARALANQALPFSVCTILRDEEVYNLITPEQEEKDRNARSRYNGRLFLSWLQDVDDKWEKIKEHMLLRHHNEAESLHAVQKMDWEWKMKELSLCDRKSTPKIDETHVPMVHVSDDFDLLPA
nr:ankyrin repeat domain-containing protein 11 isoform X1 [Leptinotarsa decemlineata]